MFRSIFTKFIVLFMCIIAFSFSILAVILCSMVNNYAYNAKAEIVERTGDSMAEFFTSIYEDDEENTQFNRFVFYHLDTLKVFASSLAGYNEDILILLVDEGGEVLLTDGGRGTAYEKTVFPSEIMSEVALQKEKTLTGDLGGIFSSSQLTYTVSLYDSQNRFVGAIFASTPNKGLTPLIQTMVKTIIGSCLWVLFVALIVLYFTTERIIRPLKEMSKAAKSFAAGKFDVRVPVKGRDEVAELATAFNNMATSLANLEDMRRTFLANVSHDLRTPMTTISGFIDGILDGAIPPEKHEYYLGVIRKEVLRLSRLVGDLLDITRIQAGERKFNKTAFDICEMARLILISFEKQIDGKKLDVSFDCQYDKMLVWADHDAIYQILYNICDNAIKFSREGGAYRISITEKDRKAYISVFDEGIGIPAEELPFVFERFYKSDKSRGIDKTGVGLGMYIAKTIIDAHGEEIWVKSVYGENCEFVFTLPYTPEGEIVVKD